MQHSQPERKIDLVIFDCDGVLVDSEMLSASVLMQMMNEVGLPITPEVFRSDFLGRSFASATERFERRVGKSFPPEFNAQYRVRLLDKMRGNLKPMMGVEEVLKAMIVPFCLATGSSPPRLAVSMEESGLEKFFVGQSFTASLVKNSKPAPDLFLHVAAAMGANATNCVVIEDSEMGVRAALAAGMQVWHFAGGSHVKAGYQLPKDVAPHQVLDSMSALHDAFRKKNLAV